MNMKNVNAEDCINSVELCDYLRKNYNKARQLKTKGADVPELILHASRQHSRWMYYTKQHAEKNVAAEKCAMPLKKEKKVVNVKEKKNIDLLAPAEQVMIREYHRNKRSGIVQSRELMDVANRYSKICRQEKKKQMKLLAAVVAYEPACLPAAAACLPAAAAAPEPMTMTTFKGLLRNGMDLIQAYDSDDDEDDKQFNKEWNPAAIHERLQKL